MQFAVAKGCLAIAVLSGGIAAAVAQTGKLSDPMDPGATVPAAKHESVFSGYEPFREEKIRSWKEVNQEVADHPGMGSMGATGSKDAKGGPKKDMPGMSMPDMDSKPGSAPKPKQGAAGHDKGSMRGMPGMNNQAAAAPPRKVGHGAMAMAMPESAHGQGGNGHLGRLTLVPDK